MVHVVHSRAAAALATLCITATSAAPQHEHPLAVVVPILSGDLESAISAVDRWPTDCSPQENVDLLLLHDNAEAAAAGEAGILGAAVETLAGGVGRCFGKVRTLHADLDEEERLVASSSRSAMFYKMFEDQGSLSLQLSAYDALALVDWEHVLVASGSAFEQLYLEAFPAEEEQRGAFWVKGGSDSAEGGPIDGSVAIYNNRDPAMVEYLDYTLSLWGPQKSYEEAMWRTLADFPGSRSPAGKFVGSDLISDGDGTPFIRGNGVHPAVAAATAAAPVVTATKRRRLSDASAEGTMSAKRWNNMPETDVLAGERCSKRCSYTSRDGTKGRRCDSSCETGAPYGTKGCHAREGKYGPDCRVCYYDAERALLNDSAGDRAIMCDTLEPVDATATGDSLQGEGEGEGEGVVEPAAAEKRELTWSMSRWSRKSGCDKCYSGCEYTCSDGTKGRVCDKSCKTGDPYGTVGCYAKNGKYGRDCRVCYNDIEKALAQVHIYGEPGIMCDTMDPPSVYARRQLTGAEDDMAAQLRGQKEAGLTKKEIKDARRSQKIRRKLQRDAAVEAGDNADEAEAASPEQAERELTYYWQYQSNDRKKNCDKCYSGCEYTCGDGTKGRVCDKSCKTGDPYGTVGCYAKSGKYGRDCRVCYNDIEKALAQVHIYGEPGIMCDTMAPPSVYARRQLTGTGDGVAAQLRKQKEAGLREGGGDNPRQ